MPTKRKTPAPATDSPAAKPPPNKKVAVSSGAAKEAKTPAEAAATTTAPPPSGGSAAASPHPHAPPGINRSPYPPQHHQWNNPATSHPPPSDASKGSRKQAKQRKMNLASPFPKLPPRGTAAAAQHRASGIPSGAAHYASAPTPPPPTAVLSAPATGRGSYHLGNNVYQHHYNNSNSHSHLEEATDQHSRLSMHSHYSNLSSASVPVRQTNAIDEVINEVNHLLQAATEAQALGRLRNSYSCLLLAHQRLVGVGRRVDRSYCEAESSGLVAADSQQSQSGDQEAGEVGENSQLSLESNMTTNTATTTYTPTFLPPLVSQPPLPPTLTTNYSDVAYVEHLARSAMELHHKRTGRGMQHEMAIERQAQAAKVKKMEEDQIRDAAGAVFALTGNKDDEEDGGGGGKANNTGKRKGGRGKKPPTLVMHTMAGRNLDVRELMRGLL